MKKFFILLIILVVFSSAAFLTGQEGREYADRYGRLSLGMDVTVPTALVFPELTEFLAGPTAHYGLTDTIELTATLEPLVRISTLLTALVQDSSTQATFGAVGALEVGARFYFSPYKASWFADADLVSVFVASDYNLIEENDSFMFMAFPFGLGASLGYDFGDLSIEGGAYLVSVESIFTSFGDIIGDLGEVRFLPFPKFSATYRL